MRPDARWSLGVGLALAVMSSSGACAEVRSINLDECSGTCVAPAINDPGAGEDDDAASTILSRFGRAADDPNFAPIFDRKAMPAALADGLPSALASASAEVPAALGVSPYDFFADIIDIPHSADAREFAAASFVLFTPSLAGRRTLTNVLWASQAFFAPPSGDEASRLGLPLAAAGGWGPARTRVTPTPSLSQISRPRPDAPVWDEWSCMWTKPLSDPWEQSSADPCR